MTLAEVVRQCRYKRGWSVRMLSEKSGICRQTICDAEHAKRGTSVSALVELLDTMGYDLVVAEKVKDNGQQTQKYRIAEAVIDKTM